MGEPDGAFDVPGDRSPRDLADHLGWSRDLVAQLVEQGHIVRTESGWRVDVAAELRQRWARSLWDTEADPPPDPSLPEDHHDADL